jgi:hypothetical protein
MKPILVKGSNAVDWELRCILTLYSGYIETIDLTDPVIQDSGKKEYEPIEPSKIPKLFVLIDGIVPPEVVAEYIMIK